MPSPTGSLARNTTAVAAESRWEANLASAPAEVARFGCREPLLGLHSRYVKVRWRQALGSAMHCVAGDGVGILAGAVIGSVLHFSPLAHLTLEYILGFGFGWTIFQALFMRGMAGGSFARALHSTFVPEFLSMNALMGGS